jgi:hypothetical protein
MVPGAGPLPPEAAGTDEWEPASAVDRGTLAGAAASRWTGCRTLAVVNRPGAGRRNFRGGTGIACDGDVRVSAGPSAPVPEPTRCATG